MNTEITHNLNENSTKGSTRPGTNAPVHNLSKGAYAFKIDRIGAKVYTDSWFTGKSSITVSITSFSVISPQPSGTQNQTTIYLYNKNNKSVGNKTITVSGGKGSTTFYGLSANEKYYVLFTVPTNGNVYSIKGDIK
ncbi:MAG: hypothetical protein HFE54_04045 [Turicibacter sp.]|jgi:hypothetical protein|uniref:Uncharacterized protein n=1 Tax=Turicibacter faecis TaxID=2963365 RepID=A0ABM8ILE8_9FIRM|nr:MULTISPECIES: hypothetical protein [unclassified Turicibacter]MCI8700708.1 hypothetical protein [Turicibacter sp.]BEH90187.1 hypothetical protein T23_02890 [Turicibacter sp. TC023]MCI9351096.1 hypothetical protein [Turicibacter sp.]MCU7203995.1 hypothetical protein [Turicibacter sp. TA25]MCU7208516.1 hypothetical protein [Turicibacter sp. 1E2]